MAQMTQNDKDDQQHSENIRTEYTAISAKLNQLPSFRFALAGFYLTAVGVIVSMEQPARFHFILLIGLTLVLWFVDLRTRQLLANISDRGRQIERDEWGYEGWISHMSNKKPAAAPQATSEASEFDEETVKWFFWDIRLPRFIRHSLGFDLMFLGVFAFSIFQLFYRVCESVAL